MGYGYYVLSDGREAGYGVEAECDREGCTERIDRGLGFLCGDNPDGWRDEDDWGCGFYFCGKHESDHACTARRCDGYDATELLSCNLRDGHEDPLHRDRDGATFAAPSADRTTTEEETEHG